MNKKTEEEAIRALRHETIKWEIEQALETITSPDFNGTKTAVEQAHRIRGLAEVLIKKTKMECEK